MIKLLFVVLLSLAVLSMGFSMVISMLESPQWIMVVLLLQALLIVSYMSTFKLVLWLPYILFLVFLGGLMVLFSYMVSLAPNFNQEYSITSLFFLITFMSATGLMIGFELGGEATSEASLTEDNSVLLVKGLFSASGVCMYSYIVAYLLVALLCISWLMKFNQGPLRLLL